MRDDAEISSRIESYLLFVFKAAHIDLLFCLHGLGTGFTIGSNPTPAKDKHHPGYQPDEAEYGSPDNYRANNPGNFR
tara:strand:+ start:278 stop:508 length:231 start_codon:yes stop_codon:yes gene_type:complete